MAIVTDTHQKSAEEIRRLFAELGEVYARAAAAALSPIPISDENAYVKLAEERRKASAIILRIRQIQGL